MFTGYQREPDDIRQVSQLVIAHFPPVFSHFTFPQHDQEKLIKFVDKCIKGLNLDRGVMFTTLYILARLKNRERSLFLPWHFTPDASFLLTLVVLKLALTSIEDAKFLVKVWIQALGKAIDRPSDALPSTRQVIDIEAEVFQYLDHNIDVTFALPDFVRFKQYLSTRPDILTTLKVELPNELPLMLPLPKISPSYWRPRKPKPPATSPSHPPANPVQPLDESQPSASNSFARYAPSQW